MYRQCCDKCKKEVSAKEITITEISSIFSLYGGICYSLMLCKECYNLFIKNIDDFVK